MLKLLVKVNFTGNFYTHKKILGLLDNPYIPRTLLQQDIESTIEQ